MANSDMPILVVDDAKFSTTVILRCLESGGYTKINHVTTAADAITVINTHDIAVLIADWMMPGMDGIELTRYIRQTDETSHRYTYIIMLTAKDGIHDLHTAFDQGIDDFINKSAMQNQLLSRILAAERIVKKQNQLRKNYNKLLANNRLLSSRNDTLQGLSERDALTGFGNELYALKHLKNSLKHTGSRGGASCYILLSISINEQAMAQTPKLIINEVIRDLGQRLKSLVRPLDNIARTNTLEFAIITQQPDLDHCNGHSFKRIFDTINHRQVKTAMGFKSLSTNMAVVAAGAGFDLPDADSVIAKARQCLQQSTLTRRIEHFHFTNKAN